MIPYTPDIDLFDSRVATYYVYCLKNPTNDEIFYVGMTIRTLKTRLSGHISDTGDNSPKGRYLKELFELGYRPLIEAIETIEGTCYIDSIKVYQREYYWIKYYKEKGVALTNLAGMGERSYNSEYWQYQDRVSKKELHWPYYYCGKNKHGVKVYDEERMKDDGFDFPRTEEHRMYQIGINTEDQQGQCVTRKWLFMELIL